jgi:2-C-methyl-D-erythritol 4-phosphate cytidylyltransferase
MNYAVIFAGGSGSRMGPTSVPKQFLDYGGKPLIVHTIEHFQRHVGISGIVVSVPEAWHAYFLTMLEQFPLSKVSQVVVGGGTGQESIYFALMALRETGVDQRATVLIHDGVRPLINEQIISDCISGVLERGSAVTSYPAVETMLESPDGKEIGQILPRSRLLIAQAPQAFRLGELLGAHDSALRGGRGEYIDSLSLMRSESVCSPFLVMGSRANIKVTTPEDYFMSKALLELEQFHRVEGI